MHARHLTYGTAGFALLTALTLSDGPLVMLTALTAAALTALTAWVWGRRCQPWLTCGGVEWDRQSRARDY